MDFANYDNIDYVKSSIFKNPNPLAFSIKIPASTPSKVPPGIRSPQTFLQVGEYLHSLLVIEINHGVNPFLTKWRKRPQAFTKAYQAQFTAYAQGTYPFNTPMGQGQDPLNWWGALEGSPNGGILAVSRKGIGCEWGTHCTFPGHRNQAILRGSTFDGR